MFIHYGEIAFNLTNSTKIEKDGNRIIVWYPPVNEKARSHCEIGYFKNECECALAWAEMKMQIHEFNKKTS